MAHNAMIPHDAMMGGTLMQSTSDARNAISVRLGGITPTVEQVLTIPNMSTSLVPDQSVFPGSCPKPLVQFARTRFDSARGERSLRGAALRAPRRTSPSRPASGAAPGPQSPPLREEGPLRRASAPGFGSRRL